MFSQLTDLCSIIRECCVSKNRRRRKSSLHNTENLEQRELLTNPMGSAPTLEITRADETAIEGILTDATPDSEYNVDFDINNDGIIDQLDDCSIR